MIGLAELLPFAALGLAGAAHCAGMCGGFSLAVVAAAGPSRARALRRALLYVSGKALTYAVLGLCASSAGALLVQGGAELAHELRDSHGWLPAFQRALSIAVGASLVAAGLSRILRASSRWPRLRPRGALARAFGRIFAGVRTLPGAAGALATGVLSGLLPCGLSWGALALALASPPATGAAGLFLFGLSTAPALLLVGLGARGLPGRLRERAARAIGPALVVLGLLAALRGGAPLPMGAALLPECCAPSEAAQGPRAFSAGSSELHADGPGSPP